jgi:hypothetical protein
VEIFEATEELGNNGVRAFDTQTLEDGKLYRGYLFDTEPTNDPQKFRYRNRTEATLGAGELEQLPLPVTLKGI